MEPRSWDIPHLALSETKTIVFIDFETTGFVPWKAARIIEYAAVKVTPTGNEIFHTLAKPFAFSPKSPIRIPYKITELTKISNEMVKDSPDTFTAFKEFYEFVKGHICIAHNAKFEKTFVQWYCDFLGLENNCIFRDTLPMLKKHYGVGKLSAITSSENAHMAFDDCVSMIRLMKECQEADPKLLTLCNVVTLSKDTQKYISESIRPTQNVRLG